MKRSFFYKVLVLVMVILLATTGINSKIDFGIMRMYAFPSTIPAAPNASDGEVERIEVSNYTLGATLKLYLTNGTLVATQNDVTTSTFTFENVIPNSLGFYVTQTVEGEESENSNFVGVSLRKPNAMAGVNYVDVSNVLAGATIKLYNSESTLISSSPTNLGDGTWRFEGLAARNTYYAIQSVNGVISANSDFVTIQPIIPAAPNASDGEVERIEVSNYTLGATLKLYLTNGTLVTTQNDVTTSTFTFENIIPNSLGFYVTQTVGGEESENSGFVGVSLRKPNATLGVNYVDVSNILAGATVKLYNSSGTLISSSPTNLGDGTWRFEGLAARSTYYAIQSINGVDSVNSDLVTIQPIIPAAPTASNGEEERIEVSNFTSGATLKLYLTNGTLVATQNDVTTLTFTFENVIPNSLGFYVTQTVGEEEGENSNFVGVSLRKPNATAGVNYVDISNILAGATVKLYNSSGTLISSSPINLGDGTWRFGGLSARSTYYAMQSINGVDSVNSDLVTIQPIIPAAPTASNGEEERIEVSNYTLGATLKLYLTDGTLVATQNNVITETFTFENVIPNSLGFYVTQTVGGEESENSGFVGVSLRKPNATAGVNYVDVSNILTGATIELYNSSGTLISSSPINLGDGTWRFGGLSARNTYYAMQSINGVDSVNSDLVTIQPIIPAAPTASDSEEERIEVSNYTLGATLKLYLTDGTLVATQNNVITGTFTFENVIPNSLGFYVTQTVGGEESENSGFVGVSLRTPNATAGTDYVDVSNILTGATIKLYNSENTLMSDSPTDLGSGTWRFGGLSVRNTYYVIQSINGVNSVNSDFVTIQPIIPSAPNASDSEEERIEVSNYTLGATLKLYLANGTLVATQNNVTTETFAFENVIPNNLGFYVTQTVIGEESENSSFVGVSLRTPTISGGVYLINVTNIFNGATVTLHDGEGNQIVTATNVTTGSYQFTNVTPGAGYYVIQSINGVVSSATSMVSVSSNVPSAPTSVSAIAGDGQAVVSFTAPESNGGSPIIEYIVTSSPGNITVTGSSTTIIVIGLTNGTTYTFTVKAVNTAGAGVQSVASNAVTPYKPSENSDENSVPISTGQNTVIVIVNGKAQNAGKETKTTENGKSTVIVKVDNKVIESKIDEAIKNNTAGINNVIQIPIMDTKSEAAKVELTGDIIKKLEENTFDVSVKRDNIEYVIPAKEFTISKIAETLGIFENDLEDISVEVKIVKLSGKEIERYNEVAKSNGAELVFPPTSFEIVAKTTKVDGTAEEVVISKFGNYVERVMEIPTGVDPSKITTGIVFNSDGTYSHVPTDVYQKDGKWYAKLNSLTNSNYSIIWNSITVKSVEKHWSKDTVNDMASRLIIFNAESFSPDKAITRADFAEYIVRALGLYREGLAKQNKFNDVDETSDRKLAILIANEYGIVTGYPDGTFRPEVLITREEAMVMYQRAMNITKLVGTDENRYKNYTDYNLVGSWAAPHVREVLSVRVFNGTSTTTISPKSNLTYAEAAQAIKNLLVMSKLINE